MGARVAALPTGRRRIWIGVGAALVLVLAVRGFIAWSDARDRATTHPASASSSALAARTVEAGPVSVKITPQALNTSGATFKIAFDNHAIDLNGDIARESKLVVNGTTWPVIGWTGDGPGGHHREGTLRFRAAGAATGTAKLTINGLPEPVVATWTLEG